MGKKLLLKRGTKAELDQIDLAEAELGYTTDEQALYIGTGTENKRVGLPISQDVVFNQNSTEKVPSAKAVYDFVDEKLEDVEFLVETTWADLVDLRDNSELVAGTWYRITDYETTTTQEETQSAGHLFDVIVLALDEKTLSEEARAIHSDRDDYFDEAKVEAWKIWYSLDNDRSRFAWADEVDGKGVIYRMIDEWDNDIPYDFKNMQFYRDKNNVDDLIGQLPNDDWFYTFTWLDELDVVHDLSILANNGTLTNDEGKISPLCNNKISPRDEYNLYSDENAIYSLPNNIFIAEYDYEGMNWFYGTYNNVIGGDSNNNLIGAHYFRNNTIGNDFRYNTIGSSFYNNTIGSSFYNNTIGNDFSYNTIGSSFCNNTIGSSFYNNTIGNSFNSNTIGNDFNSNAIGNNFNYNTIGNYFNSNAIGNNFNSNTIGNDFYSNAIGNNFYYNTIGNYFNYNAIGNNIRYVRTLDYTRRDSFKYTHLKDGLTGASSKNKLLLNVANTTMTTNDTPKTYTMSRSGKYILKYIDDVSEVIYSKSSGTETDWNGE